MTTKVAADKLRAEAKAILKNYLGQDPEDSVYNSIITGKDVDRLVDCIIGAAVLEITAIMQEANVPQEAK